MKRNKLMTSAVLATSLCLTACTMTQGNNPDVEPIVIRTPDVIEVPTDEPTTEPTAEPTESPEEVEKEWYMSKSLSYDADGTLDYITEYDENGRILKQERHGSDGIEFYYEFAYDENGKRIMDVTYDAERNMINKYEWPMDEKGRRMPFHYEYYNDGALFQWNEFEWDENDPYKLIVSSYVDGEKNESKEFEYDDTGMVKGYYYNIDGNMYEEIEYYKNGNTKKETFYSGTGSSEITSIFEYDEKNRTTKTEYYEPKGVIKNATYTEYVTEEGVEKAKTVTDNGENEIWYDENQNVIMRKDWNADGEITSWNEYEYDDDGYLCHEEIYNPEDETHTVYCDTVETEPGKKVLYYYASDNSVKEYIEHEYNENGEVTKVSDWKPTDGEMGAVYSYIYGYDENGNRCTMDYYSYDEFIYHEEYEYSLK